MTENERPVPGSPTDPLMLAITGEPLPESADPRTRAAHRAAVADVDQLRQQLQLLGDALAQEDGAAVHDTAQGTAHDTAQYTAHDTAQGTARDMAPGPAPGAEPARTSPASVPVPVPVAAPAAGRRRFPAYLRRPPAGAPTGSPAGARRVRPAVALGVLTVVACLVCGVSLVALLLSGGGASESAETAAGDSAPAAPQRPGTQPGDDLPDDLAYCSRVIAEGVVRSLEPQPDGRTDRVTVRVGHYYRPGHGAPEVTFTFPRGRTPAPRPGVQVLFSLPVGGDEPGLWAVEGAPDGDGARAERLRDRIEEDLARHPGAPPTAAPRADCTP